MRPFERYPVLVPLLKGFRRSQQTTLGLVIAAIIESSSARSMEIATLLASWRNIQFGSGLNRLYRLLRNPRIVDLSLTKGMLALLSEKLGKTLLIAVDWTEWHDELRMLSACVVSDRRAVPVHTAVFHRARMRRSQNARENTFLRLLSSALKAGGLKAVILCDRGFRRVSWLRLLLTHQLDFVIRLMDDVTIHLPNKKSRPLAELRLQPGQVLDLGFAKLRADGAVVVRVIGVWAKGAKEPWWLATSLPHKVATIVAYYDRRMTIEEQFRDTKGRRFGVKIFWTQFKNPDHLARFTQLVGVAILVWTVAGIVASSLNPSLRFNHPTKGPRQSYVTIGMRFVRLRLFQKLPAPLFIRRLKRPKLRRFSWIANPLVQNS